MPIFFIPAGVGFIEHLNLIKSNWPFLMSVIFIVPASTLLLVSSVMVFFKSRKNND